MELVGIAGERKRGGKEYGSKGWLGGGIEPPALPPPRPPEKIKDAPRGWESYKIGI